MGVIVYIAGYLCHKFPFLPSQERENVPDLPDMTFLQELDRGGLKFPSDSVTTFVRNCHDVFERMIAKKKTCRNHLIQTFELIDDMHDTNILSENVYRTLANILINNWSHSVSDFRPLKRQYSKLTQ